MQVLDIVVALNGSWSTQITIPDTAQPGEQYTIGATCARWSSGEPVNFDYPDIVVIMGQTVTPPSSDTTSSTEAPSTSSADPGTTAAAAEANPRFTG